jgi:alpha-mannosidase
MNNALNILWILIWLFITPLSIKGQTKRIYIALDDHSDIWWRADLDTYNHAFLSMLDYYINLSDITLNEPHNHQSRWNCDGSYWLWTYEKNRSSDQFQKLISYIKTGYISVPLNPLPVVWGATPAETVIRGMYYPGAIERKYNLRLPLVYSMENQTLPLGLATLWSEAGAKYSWKGICQCATNVNATNRNHEIYWMQGIDNSKILMKWYSLTDNLGNKGPGGYAEAFNPRVSIDYVDNNLDFKARYPFNIIGLFGKGWDELQIMTDEFITVSKNESNSSRSVIVSNEIDFFEDFEANYKNDIPNQMLAFGNDWDLGSAAIQEISSRLKRATEKLRNTEAISTFASLVNPLFLSGRKSAKDLAWMNMGLYFDHNIAFPGPYVEDGAAKRIAWQKELVEEIESYINSLQIDAITILGNSILKSSNRTRYFVFNSLNWARSDFADFNYTPSGPVKVIDLSNMNEVPSQVVQTGGETYLRILAKDVPAVGYKVFEIQNAVGTSYSNAATVNGNSIENTFYKLIFTPKGSISSIQSKKLGNQEFAQIIGGKTINDLGGSSSGSVSVKNAGPVSVTIEINSNSIIDHTTNITLFRDIDRIEINNIINQNFTGLETWSYGFNIAGQTITHEEVGAILKAKTETNGGHYSNKNANYEWLTMNHFADLSNSSFGITLSNADCYFMKIGNSSLTYLDQNTPQINVLAGGRVYDRGLPNQGGDNSFTQRFALQTHNNYTPSSAMRFSLEHQNPLVSGVVNGGNFYPETSMSLISIDNPDVILWSLKPSEEGIESGIVARLWNLSEDVSNFTVESFFPMLSAQYVTLIETPVSSVDIQNNTITGQVNSYGFKTFNIKVNAENTNTLIVTPQSRNVASVSGSTSFAVTSNVDWSVTDDAAWLTAVRIDAATINVTYNENASTSSRTANIVVTGTGGITETVTVVQAPANATLDVSPNSRSVTSPSGSTTFTVTSNVDWSVTDDAAWLTAARIDAATINVTYNENTSTVSRTANIVVVGTGGIAETVTVVQDGANATLDVLPNSRNVTSPSGSTTFTVTSNGDWSVTDDAAWLTATRTNATTIDVTYNENTSTLSRTATINVTGAESVSKTVTLFQDGSISGDSPVLKDFNVVIYPNPAKGIFVLRFNKIIIQEIFISVTDEVGRPFYKNNYMGTGMNNEIQTDLSFLKSGLYLISIKIEGILKVFKIIKEQ